MQFRMILHKIGKLLAGHPQLLRFLIIPAPHQQFESRQLKLCQLELRHVGDEGAFTVFKVLPDVGLLVDDALDVDLEFFAGELVVDLLVGAGGVGIVDIDEVGLDVVGDGFVVHRLPEFCLSGGSIEVVLQSEKQIHQLSSGLIIINGHNKTRSLPQGEVPTSLEEDIALGVSK